MVKYLQTSPIIRASLPHVGTQLKVMITLEGGQKALLKPQWYIAFGMASLFYSTTFHHILTYKLTLGMIANIE